MNFYTKTATKCDEFAIKFLKQGIKPNIINFGQYDIEPVVKALFPTKTLHWLDGYFNVIPLNDWKQIFEWWGERLKTYKELQLTYQKNGRDCLLPNTPLIVKIKDKIQIKSIGELSKLKEKFFVLDLDLRSKEQVWTKVNWIEKKKTNKNIITFARSNGFIQTTEDHKYYIKDKWIEGKNIKGESLKEFTPTQKQVFSNDLYINKDLAFCYGVFLADGHCSVRKTKTTNFCWQWHIDMFQKEALERCKKAIEKNFNIPMEIRLYDSQKKGSIRGGFTARRDMYRLVSKGIYGNGKKLVEKFNPIFYNNNREKAVPDIILNSNKEAKEEFLKGYLVGDGYKVKDREVWEAPCKSPSALLGLQIIANIIGWEASSGYDKRTDCPRIYFYKEKKKYNKITKPYIKKSNERVVYDINTDSGHFFSGNFLVHNCDNYAFKFASDVAFFWGVNTAPPIWGWLYKSDDTFVGGHYWNSIVYREGTQIKIGFYEPMYNRWSEDTTEPIIIGTRKYYPISFRFY